MLTMRNRSSLNPSSRALEAKSIKAAESGKYFCIEDHKQVDAIENEHIITRINLFVIQKASAKFVKKFKFEEKIRSGLFSHIDVSWDVLDPVGCSDCGEFEGERIQMALCSTNDNGKEGLKIFFGCFLGCTSFSDVLFIRTQERTLQERKCASSNLGDALPYSVPKKTEPIRKQV